MAFIRIIHKIVITVFILFLLSVGASFALDDDGFGPAKKIEGKHFIVYYAPQLEIPVLTQQLNISLSDKLLVGKSMQEGGSSAEAELADMLDTLFMRVCDILDMQLYSFQGNLKICQDYNHLNSIYYNFFNKELKTRSFYVYSLNTVYISKDDFKPEILGHEIGHAVISHYFVVLPSVKIQEVLAMYVDYQLKRAGQ